MSVEVDLKRNLNETSTDLKHVTAIADVPVEKCGATVYSYYTHVC